MIDIHSHILPGVDDGARTVEESIKIAIQEESGGTTCIISTPHLMDGSDIGRIPLFHQVRIELQARLEQEGLKLKVLPGLEVYPFPDVLNALKDGVDLSLAGRGQHILIDTPFSRFPYDFREFLFQLKMLGLTPIIAHPERAAEFQDSPTLLDEFREAGCILQVNAGSLQGKYGPPAANLAGHILRRRMAHLVSGDIHRPGRGPVMAGFRTHAASFLDNAYIQMLTHDSAVAIIEGRPLPPLPLAPPFVQEASLWDRLFGKVRKTN
jgi:protein-tyrosine phosphatase